jgi:hypothetical protein
MPIPDDAIVTVCSACQRASCWRGKFPCADYRTAATKQMTVGELRRLALENEGYFGDDQIDGGARSGG